MTFLMRGWRHRASLTAGVLSRLVGKTFNTPGGIPASSAKFASVKADKGVSGDGFTTIVQPAARAAAAFLMNILQDQVSLSTIVYTRVGGLYAIGKFQGISAAATPIGCLMVRTFFPGTDESKTVP